MKKILGLMTLCVIGLVSCQKDTTDLSSDQFLAGIVAEDINTGETTSALEFGQRGRPERDSACHKISLDSLSQTIKDYIAANYPGSTIKRAGTHKDGNIIVIIKLTDGSFKILQFDVNGAFVKELQLKGHKHDGHGHHLTEVDITSLLVTITDYIDANYAGATINRAGMTRNGEFIISISLNGDRKVLLFDANGVFVRVLKK